MPPRRTGIRVMRILLLVLILLIAASVLLYDRLLAQQGIRHLDWSGLSLSRSGVALDSLTLERLGDDGSLLDLRAEQLNVAWPGYHDGRPRLPAVHSQHLILRWQPGSQVTADATPPDPQAWRDALAWIPERLTLDAFELDLPCAVGRCTLTGSARLVRGQRLTEPAELHLELQQDGRLAQVQAQVQRLDTDWQLNASATIDQQPLLELNSTWQADSATPLWRGHVQVAQVADTRGLFAWLQQWQPADERLLHAQAALRVQADWQVTVASGDGAPDLQRILDGTGDFTTTLHLASPQLRHEGVRGDGLALALALQGRFGDGQLQLDALPDSRVSAARLDTGQAVDLRDVVVELAGLNLQLGSGTANVSGPLSVNVGRVQQANVHPLGWRFVGQVTADPQRQQLRGKLSNTADLALEVEARRDPQGALALDATLAEVFFRAANPLSKTALDWPALLEFANGCMQGKATLQITADNQPLALQVGLQFSGLDGIYDRSELRGVSGRLDLALRGQALTLDVPDLQIQLANPGLPIGPLQFQGRYSAKLDRPQAGQLQWQKAQAGLFNGQAWLAPGQLDLSRPSQQVPLQLKGVQLAEVFRVYPAEGLAGRGTLDGELPLLIDAKGVRVEHGSLAAREPGYLQFRSQKIQALGRSNPSMQLVVDALDDFHYQVLDSAVSYDEQGKLTLALRLQGRNPDLEKGRPINLNVNLEEDIPALLTSLQLTDKVSETIRQRVQERLRQRNVPAP
ncbi:intermembrane phospholipid transport protein YdbH family protein [Pseudomonas sp. Marseille-Q8238]